MDQTRGPLIKRTTRACLWQNIFKGDLDRPSTHAIIAQMTINSCALLVLLVGLVPHIPLVLSTYLLLPQAQILALEASISYETAPPPPSGSDPRSGGIHLL